MEGILLQIEIGIPRFGNQINAVIFSFIAPVKVQCGDSVLKTDVAVDGHAGSTQIQCQRDHGGIAGIQPPVVAEGEIEGEVREPFVSLLKVTRVIVQPLRGGRQIAGLTEGEESALVIGQLL